MKTLVLLYVSLLCTYACKKAEEGGNMTVANKESNSVTLTALGERFGVFPTQSYDNPPSVKAHNLSSGISISVSSKYIKSKIRTSANRS